MGKRVVHIIKVKGVSGAENHLLTLLPGLNDEYDISLLMLVEDADSMKDFAESFHRKGVEVVRIPIGFHYDLTVIGKIYFQLRKIRPHMVHTHLIHADLYGIPAAMLAGIKVLVSSKHGYDDYDHTSTFYRANKFLSPRLNRVITISKALQAKVESAEGIPRSKMTTIYYGLDAEEYASARDKDFARTFYGIPEKTFLIGSVGRLVPVKGYETLLRAVSGIDRDFRLLIMGEGPLRKRLEALASELGLALKVVFPGFSDHVSRILSGVDLFVLPTSGEGFGLVLLEAMAHGLPVVATDTMAIPEIVEHEKTGILVPPKDILSLRRALDRLMTSPDERAGMGGRGRRRVLEEFSVGKMVERTKDVYRELLDGK